MNPIFLAAGGTGGHLFPAQALAEVLTARGHVIHLVTDERVRDYGKSFPAAQTHIVPSASLSLSEPLKFPGRALRLYNGYRLAKALIRKHQPKAAVGFGGYPSLPPLVAATHEAVPSLVHEQNSVLGRANRILAKRVRHVATSFDALIGVPDVARSKLVLTGNPVRKLVLEAAGKPYPSVNGSGDIRLLVFGGSQGAKYFSDAMPDVIAALPTDTRARLKLTQQCRPEDMERVKAAYAKAGVAAELSSFFANLPSVMAESHLVVCRSGASSIAELGVVGRPAIMVPLPGAIDNDQLNNARSFERAGAGRLLEQKDASTARFSALLQELLGNPQTLKDAANAALRHGKPDAAKRLADLVEAAIKT
jgi:UDP-N-acetylglucosamine--N-acetylmuramyl-(pentapeptide) pyrophosphoryl-undecaprenol N-acetylglucosamine transferase